MADSQAAKTAGLAGAAAAESVYAASQVLESSVSGAQVLAAGAMELGQEVLARVMPDPKALIQLGQEGNADLSDDLARQMLAEEFQVLKLEGRTAALAGKGAASAMDAALYGSKRMDKARRKKADLEAENPQAALPYWQIASRHSRTPDTGYGSHMAWNRYARNPLHSMQAQREAAAARFSARHYDRLAGRKSWLQAHSLHAKDLVSAGRDLGSGFGKRAALQGNALVKRTLSGDGSLENRLAVSALDGSRKAYSVYDKARKSARILMHPVAAMKGMVSVLVSLVSAMSALVTSLPVVASFAALFLPILAALLVLSMVISTLFGWLQPKPVPVCGSWQEVALCDTGNAVKDLAYANQSWLQGTDQYEIWNCKTGACSPDSSPSPGINAYGELKLDELGFYYIEKNGLRFYCNAVGSHYADKIGDMLRITTDQGGQYYIIVADFKADGDTVAGCVGSTDNCVSASGGMLEFYIDKKSADSRVLQGQLDQNFDALHPFAGAVSKIEKLGSETGCEVGSIQMDLDFSNDMAWRQGNPYYPAWTGQCTWFAWGRFYEIYGFDPGFRGNGSVCVSQLLAAHPDKFEFGQTPRAGAVFSGVGWNHVGVVIAVNPDGSFVVDEGNAVPSMRADGTWETALKIWRRNTYSSVSQMAKVGGGGSPHAGVIFANPIMEVNI